MKLFAIVLSAIFAGLLFNAQAQTAGTSPNLVYMTTNPWQGPTGSVIPGSWSTNFTTTTSSGGGFSGGNQPGYNATTGTFMFGYSQATIAYTYAFSQALKDSGMSITGYQYTWDYINQDSTRGTLSANFGVTSLSNTSLYSKTWNLGPTTGGWTTISGVEQFNNGAGFAAANIANFSLSFTGKDDRFWAGYYGPQVRNPSIKLDYTFDACSSDPLSSPSCPGYAAAYLTQQCTANPLHSPECPGYAAAYLTQQCTISSLYSPSCPGYAVAYLNYQCSQNPLYSTTCQGYETAYFNQQCTLNPLYNTRCDGYATAYFNQQCTADALYDTKCPDYAVAYAKKMLLEQQGIAGTVATAGTIAATAPTTSTVDTTTGNVSTSTTGSTTVDKALPPPATSANAAAAPAAPVQLGQAAPQPPAAAPPREERKQEARQEGGPGPGPQGGQQGGEKPQPTARQALAERRAEAAKKDAVEKGKNLANEVGKAENLEKQKEIQNVVIAAMGHTPGFDNYGKTTLPDVAGYKPFTVYNNQKAVDNARVGRGLFGPTDRLHNALVDSQYKKD